MAKRKIHRSLVIKKIKADMKTKWNAQTEGVRKGCIIASVLEEIVHIGLCNALSAWLRHVDEAAEILSKPTKLG